MKNLYGEKQIAQNQLEKFDNRTTGRFYTIDFTIPEFTCLCPRSGFPDFACIKIQYQPKKFCVELKSLKLYINQFRNEYIFHEDVANKVLDDLVKLLAPQYMKVVADFSIRGNIHTVVTADHGEKK